MPCKDFEIFDKLGEGELRQLSSFLHRYGRAVSMEVTGFNGQEWLQYHKERMPEGHLNQFLPAFDIPIEDLPKHAELTGSGMGGLGWGEEIKESKLRGITSAVARFRLERGF